MEYLVVGYYLPCTSPCYSGWQNTPSVSNTWGLLSSGIHEDHVFIKEEIVSKYSELKVLTLFCIWLDHHVPVGKTEEKTVGNGHQYEQSARLRGLF